MENPGIYRSTLNTELLGRWHGFTGLLGSFLQQTQQERGLLLQQANNTSGGEK